MNAKRLTFQEAWDSSTIFFVIEILEDEIDDKVSNLVRISKKNTFQVMKIGQQKMWPIFL